jgi:hypothetical protein
MKYAFADAQSIKRVEEITRACQHATQAVDNTKNATK